MGSVTHPLPTSCKHSDVIRWYRLAVRVPRQGSTVRELRRRAARRPIRSSRTDPRALARRAGLRMTRHPSCAAAPACIPLRLSVPYCPAQCGFLQGTITSPYLNSASANRTLFPAVRHLHIIATNMLGNGSRAVRSIYPLRRAAGLARTVSDGSESAASSSVG